MAITSVGYERAINYAQLGRLADHAGAEYTVIGEDSFAVTPGVGDRAVSIAPGVASGRFILDTSDAPVTLNGAAVSSGSRWDMIVLRRKWDAPAGTSLVIITGTATKALPTRENTPGVLDDQPIALVRFQAGQTSVQEIVDLRVWHGNAGMLANDVLVRSYVNRLGTNLRVGAVVWTRMVVAGVAVWTDFTLDWGKLTGTPSIPASGITSGLFSVARVPHMTASSAEGQQRAYLGTKADGPTAADSAYVAVGRDSASSLFWVQKNGETVLRFTDQGVMTLGEVPVARVSGTLPVTKGGTGAGNVHGALQNLGVLAYDVGSVTVPANGSRDRTIDLPSGVNGTQFAVTVTPSNRMITAQYARGSGSVVITLFNDTNVERTTASVSVVLTRLWVNPGITPPPTT